MLGRFILIFAFALAAGGAWAEEVAEAGTDQTFAKRYAFHSGLLNEDIEYRVALPATYDEGAPGQRFPVLYVLDGGYYQTLTAYSLASNDWGLGLLMPQVIVVGVRSTNRRRDYTPVRTDKGFTGAANPAFADTGEAENYRTFLRTEFMPFIEKQYRTNGDNVLIGHSLGGLFALTDLLAEKPLFQAYIAIDPTLWFADGVLEQRLMAMPDQELTAPQRVFISQAMRGVDPATSDAQTLALAPGFDRFMAALRAKNTARMALSFQRYPADDHLSVFTPSILAGLRTVFAGYLPLQATGQAGAVPKTVFEVYDAVARDPAMLTAHYQAFSERVGVAYPVEDALVHRSAGTAERLGLTDNARALYLMGTRLYPGYARAWTRLAAFHESMEEAEAALTAYRRAFALDPADETTQQKIKDLTSPPPQLP